MNSMLKVVKIFRIKFPSVQGKLMSLSQGIFITNMCFWFVDQRGYWAGSAWKRDGLCEQAPGRREIPGIASTTILRTPRWPETRPI